MSFEAISWALSLAPVPAGHGGQPSGACKLALVGLASHAGPDGPAVGGRAGPLHRAVGAHRYAPALTGWGPGHYRAVRGRRYPIIGDGGGITWFIHLDGAAAVTVLALQHVQHHR